jgi:tRNA-modifying protein YgfZ
MNYLAELPERGVIAVEGEDRVAFLQGLVSNDVSLVGPERCVWAALLTPQGKWLADFFIFTDGDRLLLDCERLQMPMLEQRLSRYRLRMKVALHALPDWHVLVNWPSRSASNQITAPDPRLADFAWRSVAPQTPETNATAADWDLYRLKAGLPSGSGDMEADRSVLLEAGFDELSGVSWSKGCYMGQELTARTKYRGLIKRRLIPVSVTGPLPEPGTPVLLDGVDVGVMRSGQGTFGMAVLRLSALNGTLQCGEAVLTPQIQDWMQLPPGFTAQTDSAVSTASD